MRNSGNYFFDEFGGRIGNVVVYRWRGKMCMRSIPGQYNDAKTPRQLAQRALFKAVVHFASRAGDVLRIGLQTASINAQMTESNYFMRLNKGRFSIVEGSVENVDAKQDVLSVDYENLILSDGPVAPVAFAAPRMVEETTIGVDFEPNPLHRTVHRDDKVYLVAYIPEKEAFIISQPFYRGQKYAEIELPFYLAGKEMHLWGFVVDRAGRASLSQYLGNGIIDPSQWSDSSSAENTVPEWVENDKRELSASWRRQKPVESKQGERTSAEAKESSGADNLPLPPG
ncbi:MAG: hypothetical protein J6031_00605 [Bacteroidales bacterium]|nr:hypothetical protein [Bacteroidales bacterium]